MKIITAAVALAAGLLVPLVALLVLLLDPSLALGHHTLGINQAGKATGSPQIPVDYEINGEDFLFQVTVLPAHPAPGEQTRVIVHAKHMPSGKPYQGEMRIRIHRRFWLWNTATLTDERRLPFDGRYVNAIQFPEAGQHLIRLVAGENGRRFTAEIPITVGEPAAWWGFGLGLLALAGAGWVVWRARGNRRRPRPV